MNKILSAIVLLSVSTCVWSQQLSQVTFSNASELGWFSFSADQGVLIRISDEGKILEYGMEMMSERSTNYYAPKLQPYMGRVILYGTEADTINRGKIKSIGTCVFTYYTSNDLEEKKGKLKSVGRVNLDYFTHFETLYFKGRLKTIGSYNLDYYPTTDDEGSRGKLKSVGVTRIAYHSSFDDKMIKGKIKSIGSVSYTWGTSSDFRYAGGLKSGQYRQNIDGLTYILR